MYVSCLNYLLIQFDQINVRINPTEYVAQNVSIFHEDNRREKM